MLDRSLSPFQFSIRSLMDSLFRLKLVLLRALIVRIELYYILFEITYDPCNLIESRRCDSYTNRTILSSKSHIFPSQWDIFTKTQQPIKFQGLFKEINEIKRKWGTTFYKPAQYTDWINKIFLQTKKKSSEQILRLQNRCNKGVIELRVLQFWSDIILGISNQTRAARSFDFEITYMI